MIVGDTSEIGTEEDIRTSQDPMNIRQIVLSDWKQLAA